MSAHLNRHRAYVAAIHDIVRPRHLRTPTAERGNVRRDANVSLMPMGAEKFGHPPETKNVNSPRLAGGAPSATRFAATQRSRTRRKGPQETRHWHEDTRETSSAAPKSDADDYRYFPEPDLVPVVTNSE